MNAWPWEIVETLALIGIFTTGIFVATLIYMLWLYVRANVIFYYKRYKDKHFAEKCPKPRCYCIQCEYWHASESTRDTGLCCIWEKWTSANEMCARGYLRSKEEYKNEELRINE